MTCLTPRQPDRVKSEFDGPGNSPLINYFTIALTHGLLALAILRLLQRDDLDTDEAPARPKKPWHRRQAVTDETPDNG